MPDIPISPAESAPYLDNYSRARLADLDSELEHLPTAAELADEYARVVSSCTPRDDADVRFVLTTLPDMRERIQRYERFRDELTREYII